MITDKEYETRILVVETLVKALEENGTNYTVGYLQGLLKTLVVRNDETYEYVYDTVEYVKRENRKNQLSR
jgi:hypothetical protein